MSKYLRNVKTIFIIIFALQQYSYNYNHWHL